MVYVRCLYGIFLKLRLTAQAIGLRELPQHLRDLVVQRYQSDEGYTWISEKFAIHWNTVKTGTKWRKKKKKKHNSDMTKNWMFLSKLMTRWEENCSGRLQRSQQQHWKSCRNFWQSWLFNTCHNNVSSSIYVWDLGLGGKTRVLSYKEKHLSPAIFCKNLTWCLPYACGKIVWLISVIFYKNLPIFACCILITAFFNCSII